MGAQLILYDYKCSRCDVTVEEYRSYDERDKTTPCPQCYGTLRRVPSPTFGKVKGRADGKDRNDADRFTADMMGVREKDLPSGFRTKKDAT